MEPRKCWQIHHSYQFKQAAKSNEGPTRHMNPPEREDKALDSSICPQKLDTLAYLLRDENEELNQHKTPASIITLYNLTTLLAFLDAQNFCDYLFTMFILKQGLTGNLRLLSHALPDTLYSVSQPLLPTGHSALHAPHTTFHPLHTGTNTPLNLVLPALGFHSRATVQPEPHRCHILQKPTI